MEKLSGKCVLLGVTGGIAAYKMASVASGLRKAGADVHVIMTENAAQFITPLTFETLTNHRCVVDTFARNFQYDVHHVSLAKAGLPNYAILRGANSVAAKTLDLQDKTGSLEAGKSADILVLNKNPLEDISILRSKENIACVVQGV